MDSNVASFFELKANLKNFGVKDITVTGVLHFSNNESTPNGVRFRDGREAGRVEMLLSDLCGLRYSGLAEQLGVEPASVSLRVQIEVGGRVIGHVDSDGDFDFEAAPDLKTALAWKVATDGGRTRPIEGFDLDAAARTILEAIRVYGTGEKAFFGPYFEALKKVFIYEKTSRFSDGYCGAAITLWRVATRELGREHEGYDFYY